MAKKKFSNAGGIVYLLPADQLLRVKLDTKHRGGKVVTMVEGFSMNEEEIEILCKQLKTFCGAGGSAKNFEIIVQGDHRNKILEWLLKKGFSKTKKL